MVVLTQIVEETRVCATLMFVCLMSIGVCRVPEDKLTLVRQRADVHEDDIADRFVLVA